jgi:hypothetical protein
VVLFNKIHNASRHAPNIEKIYTPQEERDIWEDVKWAAILTSGHRNLQATSKNILWVIVGL